MEKALQKPVGTQQQEQEGVWSHFFHIQETEGEQNLIHSINIKAHL